MGRAGAAAAHWLSERMAGDDRPVWFAVGPGNNSGDALVAAAHLQQLGVATQAWMPVPVKPDDAQWALGLARAAGVPVSATPPASLDSFAWIVDGLFGIGLGRALDGAFASRPSASPAHARSGGHVLALDVPSEADSDTGQIVGAGVAVAATHTLTFIAAKPGPIRAKAAISPARSTSPRSTPRHPPRRPSC